MTYRDLSVFRAQPGSTFDLTQWIGSAGATYTLDVEAGAVSSTQQGGSIY